MRNLKSREIVEMVDLHGLCTQLYRANDATVEGIVKAAKRISKEWAKLNPEICDKEA